MAGFRLADLGDQMSAADVHAIMCPLRDKELESLRKERQTAERIVLALRRRLLAIDSSLPNEYDGNGWVPYER